MVTDKRIVKSSTGNREQRFVIQTFMTIGDDTWSIEITLTNRDSMGYRMLLGREAMKGRLIVDPEKSFLFGDISDSTVISSYEKFRNNTTGLRIGLLASNQELYSNRRIIEAAEQRGHQIEFYNISQCFMKLDAFNSTNLLSWRRNH